MCVCIFFCTFLFVGILAKYTREEAMNLMQCSRFSQWFFSFDGVFFFILLIFSSSAQQDLMLLNKIEVRVSKNVREKKNINEENKMSNYEKKKTHSRFLLKATRTKGYARTVQRFMNPQENRLWLCFFFLRWKTDIP